MNRAERTWIATFRDGPLRGRAHDRVFALGSIFEEMVFARMSDSDPKGWVREPDSQSTGGTVR
jgi:hypothetical protein